MSDILSQTVLSMHMAQQNDSKTRLSSVENCLQLQELATKHGIKTEITPVLVLYSKDDKTLKLSNHCVVKTSNGNFLDPTFEFTRYAPQYIETIRKMIETVPELRKIMPSITKSFITYSNHVKSLIHIVEPDNL